MSSNDYIIINYDNVMKSIQRTRDNAFIPQDPLNNDYQHYLSWITKGFTPVNQMFHMSATTVPVPLSATKDEVEELRNNSNNYATKDSIEELKNRSNNYATKDDLNDIKKDLQRIFDYLNKK